MHTLKRQPEIRNGGAVGAGGALVSSPLLPTIFFFQKIDLVREWSLHSTHFNTLVKPPPHPPPPHLQKCCSIPGKVVIYHYRIRYFNYITQLTSVFRHQQTHREQVKQSFIDNLHFYTREQHDRHHSIEGTSVFCFVFTRSPLEGYKNGDNATLSKRQQVGQTRVYG